MDSITDFKRKPADEFVGKKIAEILQEARQSAGSSERHARDVQDALIEACIKFASPQQILQGLYLWMPKAFLAGHEVTLEEITTHGGRKTLVVKFPDLGSLNDWLAPNNH